MKETNAGFSLIELLVVITIFTIVSIVTSQVIILTLSGTRKAETISKVRQNLDFAMATMDRQLHSAKSVNPCPNPDNQQITFVDQEDNLATFSCVNTNDNNQPSHIASASGSLTADYVMITACSFTCTPGLGSAPPYVTISITAKQLTGAGTSQTSGGQNNAVVTSTTQITLRSY